MDDHSRRLLFGTDEAVPAVQWLTAGPLALRLCGTRLLSVHHGPHEVWHGVAFLYRDRDWGTPEPVLDAVEHETRADGFRVLIRAHLPVSPRIDLRIDIEGDDSGRVRYEGTATPSGDIHSNRTGLCLMHGLSAVGRPVEVHHDDGRRTRSTFPQRIAPWPPFMAVRALCHEYADGAWARADFEGDVFELEDQRNNADASFKTYNRSNFMPRPYRLRAGQPVRQAVELRLTTAPAIACPGAAPVRPPAEASGLLRLGIGIECADAAQACALAPWLRQLAPRHLHLRTDVAAAEAADWAGVRSLLEAAGARLWLDLTQVPDGAAEQALWRQAALLADAGIGPESVTAFPSTPPVVNAARRAFPGSRIGGGSPHFFTQLNRLDDLGQVDHLRFGTSALVHGADDESVMAGLHSLPWMMSTLASAHPGVPVHVGPSDIGARGSPLGAQPHSDGRRRLAFARHDPRSRALFGAAWLLGYVAAFHAAGADGLSIATLLGPSGLLREQAGRLRPCPAYYALQWLHEAARWHAMAPPWAQGVACLGCRDAGATTLALLANLGTQQVDVGPGDLASCADLAGSQVQLIDAEAWRDFEAGAASRPWRRAGVETGRLRLPPLAIARLKR